LAWNLLVYEIKGIARDGARRSFEVAIEGGQQVEQGFTWESGLEILSEADCRRRLAAGGVGILALCGLAAPVLRPVNFALHEDWILVRTGVGQILQAAIGAEPASFTICEIDRLEHTGWSVVVTGKLVERSSLAAVEEAPLRPWARAEKHHFVGLSIDEISGRRIAVGPGAA
jgi:nitroimidazol reductase NimA-like FMN-containing flavoprotein (pyridoxamine 5'-phosphate oxidase superfamily)